MSRKSNRQLDTLPGEEFLYLGKDFTIGRSTSLKILALDGMRVVTEKCYRFLTFEDYVIILRTRPELLDQLRFSGTHMDFLYRINADITIETIYMRVVPFEQGVFRKLETFQVIKNSECVARKVKQYYYQATVRYRGFIENNPSLDIYFNADKRR